MAAQEAAVGIEGKTQTGRPATIISFPFPVSPTLLPLTGPLPSMDTYLCVTAEQPLLRFLATRSIRKHSHTTHPLGNTSPPTEGPVGTLSEG